MGFYTEISWESRCNNEINVWSNSYPTLIVFFDHWQTQADLFHTDNSINEQTIKRSLDHSLSISGSFSYIFPDSPWTLSQQGTSQTTKNKWWKWAQTFILLLQPRKCPRKPPFQHTVPPLQIFRPSYSPVVYHIS